jgi:hypothetical protein
MAAVRANTGLAVSKDRFGQASGLAFVQPGFCHSSDYDALFALGWPHLRFVVDGHCEDADPPGTALRILQQPDPPTRFAWPRRVAQGLVRAWGLPAVFELAPGVRDVRQEPQEVVWREDPISPDEARVLIACRVAQDAAGVSERAIETFVLLAEALLGAEEVGAAILEALEALPADTLLTTWTLPPILTWHLGFLMLRVPAATATGWRARLERLRRVVYDANPALERAGFRGAASSHARSIHLVLGGGKAAEGSTDRSLRWYAHTTDDPVLVRMRVAVNRLSYEPDARLVFLGGLDVLARYARDWTKLGTTDAQRWFLEQIAPIAAPEMFPLMLELAGRSLVRPEATAWFAARAPQAGEFLAQTARGDGASATYARQVQKALAEGALAG